MNFPGKQIKPMVFAIIAVFVLGFCNPLPPRGPEKIGPSG